MLTSPLCHHASRRLSRKLSYKLFREFFRALTPKSTRPLLFSLWLRYRKYIFLGFEGFQNETSLKKKKTKIGEKIKRLAVNMRIVGGVVRSVN